MKVSSVNGLFFIQPFSIFLLSISSYSYCSECLQIVYVINKEKKSICFKDVKMKNVQLASLRKNRKTKLDIPISKN